MNLQRLSDIASGLDRAAHELYYNVADLIEHDDRPDEETYQPPIVTFTAGLVLVAAAMLAYAFLAPR